MMKLNYVLLGLAFAACAAPIDSTPEGDKSAASSFASSTWEITIGDIMRVEKDGEELSLDPSWRTFNDITFQRVYAYSHWVAQRTVTTFGRVESGTELDFTSDHCIYGAELQQDPPDAADGLIVPLDTHHYELFLQRDEWVGDRRDVCVLGFDEATLDQGSFEATLTCSQQRYDSGSSNLLYPGRPGGWVRTGSIDYTFSFEARRTDPTQCHAKLSFGGAWTTFEDPVLNTSRRLEGADSVEIVRRESMITARTRSRANVDIWNLDGSPADDAPVEVLDFSNGPIRVMPGLYILRTNKVDPETGGRAIVTEVLEIGPSRHGAIVSGFNVPHDGHMRLEWLD